MRLDRSKLLIVVGFFCLLSFWNGVEMPLYRFRLYLCEELLDNVINHVLLNLELEDFIELLHSLVDLLNTQS